MSMVENPTLSLCMIVKNEEHFIENCLNSVKDVVDEMIIVDTGSTDRTVELAEGMGAKVYHHAWENDFSKARNISLNYASCDWILVIDADEELDRRDAVILKNALKSDKYDVIFCAVLSKSSHGISKNYSHRIFRRGKAHYEGIVHNQLVHDSHWLHTNIRIYHYGYDLSPEKMQAKFRRTESLLLKQLEVDPQNAFAYQNYVRILRVQNLYQQAVETGFKALEVCGDKMNDLHFQMIAGDTAFSLISLDEFDKAEILLLKVLKHHPFNMDINFALGLVYQGQKKYRVAIETFFRFLKLNQQQKTDPQHTLVLIDSFDFDHRAWGNISDCYFYLKDYENAKIALENALSINSEIAVYYTAYARTLIALGEIDKAKSVLTQFESTHATEEIFYEKWAGLAKLYPDFGNVLDILKHGIEQCPQSIHLRNILAFHISSTDAEIARQQWKYILEHQPDHLGAHIGMVTLSAQADDKDAFVLHAKNISSYSNDTVLLKKTGYSAVRLGLYEQAIELFEKYLMLEPNDVDILIDISTCYAKIEKYQAAFTGYKTALQSSPGNPKVLNNLKVLQNILSSTQMSSNAS